MLQVKGIPILSYEIEALEQDAGIVYKVGIQLENISSEEKCIYSAYANTTGSHVYKVKQ